MKNSKRTKLIARLELPTCEIICKRGICAMNGSHSESFKPHLHLTFIGTTEDTKKIKRPYYEIICSDCIRESV